MNVRNSVRAYGDRLSRACSWCAFCCLDFIRIAVANSFEANPSELELIEFIPETNCGVECQAKRTPELTVYIFIGYLSLSRAPTFSAQRSVWFWDRTKGLMRQHASKKGSENVLERAS